MVSASYPYTTHSYDVLIIGAGGAGLRAAIAAAEGGAKVAIVSKVPPMRTHTAAAQGGINAALGNVTPDDWRWHMYDTVRGSDWLSDQDAVAFMCKEAPGAIRDLEKMGVHFSRDEQGNIYQRAYGGMSTHFGKGGMAYRACAAADHIGNAMMQGLSGHVHRYDVDIHVEFVVLDLLRDREGAFCGVLALELASGELHVFLAHNTILATGGYGQIYAACTSASGSTGDGNAFALRAGLALQDMEYVQFHPTGLYGYGLLISEAARGEGGRLLNAHGERFMERYAPEYRDLASRDVVTRAIVQEVLEGRGCGVHKDHVLLDVSHLREEMIAQRLPTIRSIAKQFAGVDIAHEPVPVYPTAHYTMGGIPANRESEVIIPHAGGKEEVVPGLFVIGEAACNSVHGANRLGCNSLLDLVVFGKAAGERCAKMAAQHLAPRAAQEVAPESLAQAFAHLDALRSLPRVGKAGGVSARELRTSCSQIMLRDGGIIREGVAMQRGLQELRECMEQFQHARQVSDASLVWNNELVQAIEAENLLLQAIACLSSAQFRTESRGAHYRSDFTRRDNSHWLAHSIVMLNADHNPTLYKRAVRFDPDTPEIDSIKPEKRGY
jgi:succinate dehydrogenase / fumarate reductase flavoprotein subunit